MSIQEFFDSMEDSCYPDHKACYFKWTAKGTGFGEFGFYEGDDGKLHCSNEMMSKKFIKEMLCKMVDDCVLDDGPNDD